MRSKEKRQLNLTSEGVGGEKKGMLRALLVKIWRRESDQEGGGCSSQRVSRSLRVMCEQVLMVGSGGAEGPGSS